MSFGRRLLNMARAELNSLLDLAAKRGNDDNADLMDDDGGPLGGYTERELREELERRNQAEREVDEALNRDRFKTRSWSTASDGPSEGGPRRSATVRPSASALQKAYAALEVPAGSDFETVRKSYRNLMRQYHPDHHTASPEKQRAANEVAQRLTEAYKLLEKRLRP